MNKNEMFNKIAGQGRLRRSDLDKLGLSEQDIQSAISLGKMKQDEDGYLPIVPDEMYAYGIEHQLRREYRKAISCFRLCLEMDRSHYLSNLQMIKNAFAMAEYTTALNYILILKNSTDSRSMRDYNFFLYLFSFLIELPKPHLTEAFSLTLEDILIPEDNEHYKDISASNHIRELAFKREFIRAISKLNDQKSKGIRFLGQKITQQMLSAIINKIKTLNGYIDEAIISKDYDGLVAHLNIERMNRPLKKREEQILNLSNDLVTMRNTGLPLLPQRSYSKEVSSMIVSKQYERAYINSLIFAKKKGIEDEKNSYSKLLWATIATRDNLLANLPPDTARFDYLRLIYKYLTLGAYDEALTLVDAYLASKNLQDYDYLIADLVKKELHTPNSDFVSPMHLLDLLSETDFQVKIGSYIKNAQKCLIEGHIEKAELLIEIANDIFHHGHIGDNSKDEIIASLEELKKEITSHKSHTDKTKNFCLEPTVSSTTVDFSNSQQE